MEVVQPSIYPDFFRIGVGKLDGLGSRDLIGLFSSLEHFQRDLKEQEDVPGILEVTQSYCAGLELFGATAFYLTNPASFEFEQAVCHPAAESARLDQIVRREIRSGKFAWALRQNAPVVFAIPGQSARGVFHSLSVSGRTLGMYCGLLREERVSSQEIAFSLLAILLGACADALAVARTTAELRSRIKTLSGLLPICARCKKIRDDRGYWNHVEQYIQQHTEARFSHGMCPACIRECYPEVADKVLGPAE